MRGSPADDEFDRRFPELYRDAREVAYRVLGDHRAADTVATETMADAFARWRRLRDPMTAREWVLRRAVNGAIDAAPPAGDVEPVVLNEALGPALASLPRPQAEALALRFLTRLGPAEVAAALGRTPAKVDADVAAGLPVLARKLGRWAGELPTAGSAEAAGPPVQRTDVLVRVRARGRYMRSRVVTAALLAALILLLGAGVAGLVSNSHHDDNGTLTAGGSTTLAPPSTDTTVTIPFVTLPAETTTTASPTTTAKPATTTTTTACRNSTDPACGPFRWDPAPAANQPLTVKVVASTTSASVGQMVTFTINTDDPDAVIADDHCRTVTRFGDEGPQSDCTPQCPAPARYGPWTPPSPQHGIQGGETVSHAYTTPGIYTATFRRNSGGSCPENKNPYASEGSATVEIHVS